MRGLSKRKGQTDFWECELITDMKGLLRPLQVVSAGQTWIWSCRLKGIVMLLKCKLQNCLCSNNLRSSFSPVLSSSSDRAPHMLPLGCVHSLIDWHISKANFSCSSAKTFLLLNFSPSLLLMPPVRLPELLLPRYGFIDLGSVQAIFNWLNLLLAVLVLGWHRTELIFFGFLSSMGLEEKNAVEKEFVAQWTFQWPNRVTESDFWVLFLDVVESPRTAGRIIHRLSHYLDLGPDL